MKKRYLVATTLAALMSSVACATEPATDREPADGVAAADTLFDTVSALDGAMFDAFNQCSASKQLQEHASYFADDVEFYHDTGGVTWTRRDMLANTAKNACGKYRRELVPGTLKVFPIKDYGAIAQGVHRFCQAGATECEGMAEFVIVWRRQGEQWQITRILSYGHRPNQTTDR